MVKINLNKIPSERVYIKLNKKAIEFVSNIIEKSGAVLSKEVKDQIYRLKKGKKVSITFVKKISGMLDIELSFFEKNIDLVTSCKNTNIGVREPKFPINFARREGVIIISAIMGDGEINNQIMPRYNNQDKKLIDNVLYNFKRVFGDIDYKIYLREDKTYQLAFPKIAGLVLLAVGLKKGYKSVTNYGIPEFIFNLDKYKKAEFIKQFFNDEGNVRLKDRRLQIKQTLKTKQGKEELKLNPEKYAHKALLDIQKLISDIGITSKISLGNYRKSDKRADWELSIYGKENLEIFQKEVGFDLEYKNKLLNESIKSYKFPSAPRNRRIDFALEKFKKAQDKHGFVTKSLLAKESKRAIKTATYFIIDLKKKGLIKEIERPRDEKGHPKARKYRLNEV